MSSTLIRGSTQIKAGSITADRFVTGLALATSQLADGALFIKSDGSVAMGAALSMGGFNITSVATPVSANDAANKSYVDALANGLTFKKAVKVIGAANIGALSGLLTVDGVTLSDGDRVLLIAQTSGSQNGIWTVHSGGWTRPADWAGGSSQPEGTYILTDPDGTTYKNTKWYCSNTGAITVDTTATTWVQDMSGTSYTAGNGLSLTGTQFAAVLGNGVQFDGSNNIAAKGYATRLVTVDSNGIGITDGTSAQIVVANGSGHAAWATVSGDATISNTGSVTVNHTAGSGFLKYGDEITGETPSGTVNGSNTAFTLANTPQNSSVKLYLNGQRLTPGSGNDYTISGTAITMLVAPLTGDVLLADYNK